MPDEEQRVADTYRGTIKWILGLAGTGLLGVMAVVVFLWSMVQTDLMAIEGQQDRDSAVVAAMRHAKVVEQYEVKTFMYEMRQQAAKMAEKAGVEVVVDTTIAAPPPPDTTVADTAAEDST